MLHTSTQRPSGLNVASRTGASCCSEITVRPPSTSQTRTILSWEAVTMFLPSELKRPELIQSSCRNGGPIFFPTAASHSCAVRSRDAVKIFFPSGLKQTDWTRPWCEREKRSFAVFASHTKAEFSEMVTNDFPFGLATMSLTSPSCLRGSRTTMGQFLWERREMARVTTESFWGSLRNARER